eukprot:TRINITY_DN1012_c0_g1_i2.p1 TRINITY_DN1012_c0_g1~~TRINITY_DN1012_c0_g1_i2.p1  ORF type:complete len:399 (+),score=94.27 TRINITY_DN1012_c0_g1_i2:176-1372(+)
MFTPEDLELWKMDLHFLLDHPIGVQYFKQYLASELAAENIYFYLDCLDYVAIHRHSPAQAKEKARQIYHMYISTIGAEREVNISGTTRSFIHRNVDKAPPDLYRSAQQEIFSLMERDSYPRFLGGDSLKLAQVQAEEAVALVKQRKMERFFGEDQALLNQRDAPVKAGNHPWLSSFVQRWFREDEPVSSKPSSRASSRRNSLEGPPAQDTTLSGLNQVHQLLALEQQRQAQSAESEKAPLAKSQSAASVSSSAKGSAADPEWEQMEDKLKKTVGRKFNFWKKVAERRKSAMIDLSHLPQGSAIARDASSSALLANPRQTAGAQLASEDPYDNLPMPIPKKQYRMTTHITQVFPQKPIEGGATSPRAGGSSSPSSQPTSPIVGTQESTAADFEPLPESD